MEGTESPEVPGASGEALEVAATRPAWRVLKGHNSDIGTAKEDVLQRLDPHGGY